MGDQPAHKRVLPPFKRAVNDDENKLSPAESSAPDIKNEYAFFELAHNNDTLAGFKITFAGGNMAAIYYHDIVSPITFDGAGIIELGTPVFILKISGKNLQVLFDHLFESRVSWIKEPDASFAQMEEGQPEIESIKLEPKE